MIICTGCEREFKVLEVGVPMEQHLDDQGTPYKLFMADLLQCACGHKIAVTDKTQKPIAEHFQPDYQDKRARFEPRVIVRA